MNDVYIKIDEAMKALLEFVNSEDLKRFCDATVGETKLDGFRSGMMIAPSIILAKSSNYRFEKQNKPDQLNPKFPYKMEKAKWYLMFLFMEGIISAEEFDDLYGRLPPDMQ